MMLSSPGPWLRTRPSVIVQRHNARIGSLASNKGGKRTLARIGFFRMRRRGMLGWKVMALGAAAVVPVAAHAGSTATDPDCFDALVYASIVRQTPTVFPDCGDDCIVMSWPWVVELDVERVIRGKVPSISLTVITVQHTSYRTDLGARRWWLRRNSLGAFNVLRLDDKARLPRCAEGSMPAKPYIRPGDGRTLRDLAREGEEYYGKQP